MKSLAAGEVQRAGRELWILRLAVGSQIRDLGASFGDESGAPRAEGEVGNPTDINGAGGHVNSSEVDVSQGAGGDGDIRQLAVVDACKEFAFLEWSHSDAHRFGLLLACVVPGLDRCFSAAVRAGWTDLLVAGFHQLPAEGAVRIACGAQKLAIR